MTNLRFVTILVAAVSGAAYGGDFKIVANPSVSVASISADELKDVFLGTKTALSNGSHVEPVIVKSGAAHESFLKAYIGKSETALEAYYYNLVFAGKGTMPKTLGNDAEVLAYVAKTKGAIGYVSAAAPANGVKTIEVK